MIGFYNEQVEAYKLQASKQKDLEVENFIESDPKKIKWASGL